MKFIARLSYKFYDPNSEKISKVIFYEQGWNLIKKTVGVPDVGNLRRAEKPNSNH